MFTKDEDDLLKYYFEQVGIKNWNEISSHFMNRSPKNCRDRYINYLSPLLRIEEWSASDDDILLELMKEYGKKWTIISDQMHRSPNTVKNRWYRFLSKSADSSLISTLDKKKETIRVARLVFPDLTHLSLSAPSALSPVPFPTPSPAPSFLSVHTLPPPPELTIDFDPFDFDENVAEFELFFSF
jgi:hypothetical protein